MNILYQIIRYTQFLGSVEQLVLCHRLETADLCLHHAHMAYSLYHVTGTRFALGADHGCALVDAAQCLAQILCAADKRHVELGLVDVIHLDRLQDLCLCEVTDTALCHDRDADSLLDATDHFRVAHTGYAAGCTDVCRDALQCHNSTSAGCLCDLCLFRCSYVHNDAALEHLRQVFVQFITISHGDSSINFGLLWNFQSYFL